MVDRGSETSKACKGDGHPSPIWSTSLESAASEAIHSTQPQRDKPEDDLPSRGSWHAKHQREYDKPEDRSAKSPQPADCGCDAQSDYRLSTGPSYKRTCRIHRTLSHRKRAVPNRQAAASRQREGERGCAKQSLHFERGRRKRGRQDRPESSSDRGARSRRTPLGRMSAPRWRPDPQANTRVYTSARLGASAAFVRSLLWLAREGAKRGRAAISPCTDRRAPAA